MRRLKLYLVASALFLASFGNPCLAQGSAGSDAKVEPRYLIDLPTAGIIAHGSIALDVDFFQSGGILGGFSVGALNRLLLGVYFGGTNIVGTDQPTWNNNLGVNVKLRVLEEDLFIPAIDIGFSSQGKGAYIDRLHRYVIKSLGFYAVGSKNYRALGFFSVHGGINYSLERDDGDDDINVFGGVEKTLGPFLSLLGEYDLAMNDSNRDALGRGRGYLNLGFRVSVGNGLMLGFVLKDVLQNQQDVSLGNRVVQLEYVK